MTYTELVEAVYSLTNRPEMVGETALAVQSATLKAHQSDFYTRDSVEKLLVLAEDSYIAQVDLSVLVRYRAMRWLRKWDPAGFDPNTQLQTGTAGEFIEPIEPEMVIDSYGYTKANRWYVAGNFLNIRSNTSIRQVLMSYYQAPKVAPVAQYSSWVADTVPFAIIFDAASTIFQLLGQNDQSRKYDTFVLEQLMMVRQHGLLSRA